MEKKKDPANCTQNLLENFCSDLPVGIGIKRIKKNANHNNSSCESRRASAGPN